MIPPAWRLRPGREAVLAFALTGALPCLAVWLVFRPLDQWLAYPLVYSGDGIWNLFVMKTVATTGWYGREPALGAPFGATLLDFPNPETLYHLFHTLAWPLLGNIVVVHNLFYFAGFPLAAWTALVVLRRALALAWPFAVAGAVLFACLPFHFARMAHVFLAAYVVVPLGAWLVLRAGGERPPFFESGRLGWGRFGVWLLIAVVASTSVYYAFFTIVLVAATGVLAALSSRSWRPAASAALVAGLLAAAVAVNLLPSLRHRAIEGAHAVAQRSLRDVESLALRPIQLLLPPEAHRIRALGDATRSYVSDARAGTEARTAALGVLGAAGFLLLLLHVLVRGRVLPDTPVMATLAQANLVALLLGVTGGFGALFAFLVTAQFRGLNRVSVFIGFFAIAAVMTAASHATRRRWPRHPRAAVMVAAALVALGLFDQLPAGARRPQAARMFESDRAFVAALERTLTPGAMVYQLPYVAFPESRPVRAEPEYSLLRPYLHSTALRWGLGGMKGRAGDRWHRMLDDLPLRQRVAIAQSVGFAGVLLDRLALRDLGRDYDAALRDLGLSGPIDSADGSLGFFRMPPAPIDPEVETLFPVPGRGFHRVEGQHPDTWIWSAGSAGLLLHNFANAPKHVELSFALDSPVRRQVIVQRGGRELAAVSLEPRHPPVPVRLPMEVAPGWTTIDLETDAPGERAGRGDGERILAFRVSDVRLASAGATPQTRCRAEGASRMRP